MGSPLSLSFSSRGYTTLEKKGQRGEEEEERQPEGEGSCDENRNFGDFFTQIATRTLFLGLATFGVREMRSALYVIKKKESQNILMKNNCLVQQKKICQHFMPEDLTGKKLLKT